LADVERDRLGRPALFGDVGHHPVQFFLAAAGNHHNPAVGGEMLRPGLADSAAAAGHPGHAFPIIWHANCLRCFLKGVFANPALILYLGTVRAGAVYLPLNTAYTLNELEYFIGDAEPTLVVCDPSRADGIGTIAAKVGAKVETLGSDGKGSLTDATAKASGEF